MEFLCVQEQAVFSHWKEYKNREPFPERLIWQTSGCKIHQNVRPCGNKEERGVPYGASCSACPLNNEVETYTK